jgi:hypothetical protein
MPLPTKGRRVRLVLSFGAADLADDGVKRDTLAGDGGEDELLARGLFQFGLLLSERRRVDGIAFDSATISFFLASSPP